MYACTGASPSAFAICGLPPERRTTPRFDGDLGFVPDRRLLARDVLFRFFLRGTRGAYDFFADEAF